MKKFTILTVLLSFIMIGFTSCKKNETSITCHLGKADKAPSAMTILFKATKTGDGVISTLTYQVGSFTKTVSNPALPWNASVVNAAEGDNISITATGTTSEGSLTISYDGKNGTSEIQGKDYCSHSNN